MGDVVDVNAESYVAGLIHEAESYDAKIKAANAVDDNETATRLGGRLDQVKAEAERVGKDGKVTPPEPDTTERDSAPERAVSRGRGRGSASS